MPISSNDAVRTLWHAHELPAVALEHLHFTGAEPVLPSSFAIGTAAQSSLGLAALAAAEVGRARNGLVQDVAVDMADAAIECSARFSVDGVEPQVWDPIAGLYPCGPAGRDGWVRLHTNFAHHRDGVLRLLGLPEGAGTARAEVAAALAAWHADDFESAAAEAGLVVAALRDFAAWEAHPQHAAVAALPLVEIVRIGEAPPLAWPELATSARPLEGLRVVELTRILAGPAAGRTLAGYGADVLLVNSPHLPNISAIADTSRGKRSALADLRNPVDREALERVLDEAHVFLQSYRPGSLDALGFGPRDTARRRPGIVHASLCAYGGDGPWADRRGFDSLVQTATGFNHAEAAAANTTEPKALPVQLLDMASGHLLAFGIERALLRQRQEGGSWHVRVSLARTALWLRELGRVPGGFAVARPDFASRMETSESGFGRLTALRHAARLSATPAGHARPSMPPGSHPLSWR